MSLGKRRLRKAVVVCCRSGPGFRVVLCLLTLSGMPILETMPSTFATVEEARRFASEELGALPEQIQLRTKRA